MGGADAATLEQLRKQISYIETHGPKSSEGKPRQGKGLQTRGQQGKAAFDSSSEDAAFAKVQRLLCRREHASALLRRRLMSDGFDEQTAANAVQRALDCGLVSDARYADVLVRSRVAQGKGIAGIAHELQEAEIDPQTVPNFVELELQSSASEELDRALGVLQARPPRAKHLREAAYRKLVQKGYGSSIASQAARIFSEQVEGRDRSQSFA